MAYESKWSEVKSLGAKHCVSSNLTAPTKQMRQLMKPKRKKQIVLNEDIVSERKFTHKEYAGLILKWITIYKDSFPDNHEGKILKYGICKGYRVHNSGKRIQIIFAKLFNPNDMARVTFSIDFVEKVILKNDRILEYIDLIPHVEKFQ